MSELKSKLPDLKELGSIACKFGRDVKQSLSEIVHDYKKKREQHEECHADGASCSASSPEEKKQTASTQTKKSTKSEKKE